ncbi:PIN domain-containing protein [Vreelandella aquamarina]|uniref:PIN-like domain-containing protein n=1 Tax=Vreelandella aquamarina TaxID=77097 RepID=UPI00384C4BB6
MNMKDIFPEYFKDKEEISQIWKDCVFVFDANVIIDLYRYSDSTKKSLLDALRKFRGRAWISYQASEEYLRNRASVIASEEVHYADASDKIDKFVSVFKDILGKNRQHPFISEEASGEFFRAAENIKKELERNGKEYFSRVSDDEIRKELVKIFDGQVGRGFDEDELNEIFERGIDRYNKKIPPGYEDVDKCNGEIDDGSMSLEQKKQVFGDLIIWEEVIRKSVEDSKNIILVTGDVKEDWWKKSKGKTLGPRTELIKEFENRTGRKFYMYTSYKFLDISSENEGGDSIKDAVEEIKETNVSVSNKNDNVIGSVFRKINEVGGVGGFYKEDVWVNDNNEESEDYNNSQLDSYLDKVYMLSKEISELDKKNYLYEEKISRHKARLERLKDLDEYLGVDAQDKKTILTLNNVIDSLNDAQKRVQRELLGKKLEMEYYLTEKEG